MFQSNVEPPIQQYSEHSKGVLYIIDVSQSVEHDHPFALDFLRFDCRNINLFFSKQKVKVPSVRELFEFIVETNITDENLGKIYAQ